MAAPGRLRASADIQAVFAARRSRAGRFLVVHGRERAAAGEARVAVVASRRVGSAVRRNRAKRLLREAARQLAWRPGHDVVLLARADCAAARLDPVIEDLRSVASHLRLLDEASTCS